MLFNREGSGAPKAIPHLTPFWAPVTLCVSLLSPAMGRAQPATPTSAGLEIK